MSLASKCSIGGSLALLVWSCAKAEDSPLVGSAVPSAGRGGSAGTGVGGTLGSGGTSTGKGGSSGVGGSAATGGSGGSGAGTGGTSGAGGSGGLPACGSGAIDDAGVVLRYIVGNASAMSDQLFMHLYFENKSDQPLDLAHVTVRYWMTAEPEFDSPVTDYRGPQVSGEHATYVDDGELSHLFITFSGNEVPPHNDTDLNPTEVQFRIQGRNGARFDQSNDYSFAPTLTSNPPAPNDHITVYIDGALAWGKEPSGRCPDTGEGGAAGEGGQGGESNGGSPQGGQAGEAGATGN